MQTVPIEIARLDNFVDYPYRDEETSAYYDLFAAPSEPLSILDQSELKNNGKEKVLCNYNGKMQIVLVSQLLERKFEVLAQEPMILIKRYEIKMIPFGFETLIPFGWHCELLPRSGFKIKGLLTLPGIIDHVYSGEWKAEVLHLNPEVKYVLIQKGDRTHQMTVHETHRIDWQKKSSIDRTINRGGFGSTGVGQINGNQRHLF